MTQAFNLSQLANKVNTSGQIDVSTAATGTLSPANGGTGLSSVGTSGNVLTSNGSSWVSQALPAGGVTSLNGQTGAITNTSLYAIGSYVTGRPANATSYAANDTIAGSILTVGSPNYQWEGSKFAPVGRTDTVTTEGTAGSGTWRCMSGARSGPFGWAWTGLWVRIS
jgi:hypothetical protein